MDHHEQNLLGHVLGGAHNGQHGVNREVEDHETVSNAGKVEAQMRTMRDYMNLTRKTPISVIDFPHITLL